MLKLACVKFLFLLRGSKEGVGSIAEGFASGVCFIDISALASFITPSSPVTGPASLSYD